MLMKLVVLLLASTLAAPVTAIPLDAPKYEIVYGTSKVPDISNLGTSKHVNQNRKDAAEGIAQYLEGLTAQGVRCGLDKNQAYYNLVTWTIDGQGYEANIYFTGRIPQTVSADYSW
ncbi:uncharacterized protein N0V89_009268 [Didymosphaeria variabile]|uniref:Uncharacterized protein n=1 Tax=Didymosphaeria variabile TaxID=1932322 RepID=A0A9W8XD25_9PLEO|nr:uncharacterized protein N0V89_009268 [Didymosphaeria variabile]KAJ4347896.1 hypothetical protein N0V89_009268 [Didymosphaeria variabile]